VEPPFIERERLEIADVVEWLYRGQLPEEGEEYPDGSVPSELIEKWGRFYRDYRMLERRDGTIEYKYPGAYSEQPAFDLEVYRSIRMRLTALREHG
jgi:hypothetical protein